MSVSLHRLVYRSDSCIDHSDTVALNEIFETSVRNNKRDRITGALALPDGTFVQVLEGSRTDLSGVMARIQSDARHRNIKVLAEWSITARLFNGWAMARPNLDPLDTQSFRIATRDGTGAQVVGLLAAMASQPDQWL